MFTGESHVNDIHSKDRGAQPRSPADDSDEQPGRDGRRPSKTFVVRCIPTEEVQAVCDLPEEAADFIGENPDVHLRFRVVYDDDARRTSETPTSRRITCKRRPAELSR